MTHAAAATPVIIVGAPRSGTNMLRDALCTLPRWATWPCDEINYIWRHGNVRFPSDEFTEDMATPTVARYIKRQFKWVERTYDARVVVEKTCATSLRVRFAAAAVPDARFVFIRRNGIDVVGSALHRWTAPAEFGYLAQKARFVPWTDLPYYGSRFILNRIHQMLSRERRLAFWGPQMHDMDALLRRHPLDEICAIQWQRCLEQAASDLAALKQSRCVVEVEYERLVHDPKQELARVVTGLGMDVPDGEIERASAGISGASVGKGARQLGPENVARISQLVGSTLAKFNYA